MTTIFVTHDQTEANALADRIAVMEEGVLQQCANPKELRERPANPFVATFVGEPPMNVFEASVINADTISFVVKDGPTLTYAQSDMLQCVRVAIGRREKAIIGVRPHAVRLGAGANKARVVSNQWLGDQSHLASDVAGRLMVAVTHSPIAVKTGEIIAYRFAATDLHVFDAESGASVSDGLAPAR